MRIEGPKNDVMGAIIAAQAKEKAKQAEKAQEQAQQQEPVKAVAVEEPKEEQVQPEKQKGVIRNLLNGHFKGVAELRLRMNHAEELAEIQGQAVKESAGAEFDKVLTAVGTKVDEIKTQAQEKTAEIDEALGGFTQQAGDVVKEFQAGTIQQDEMVQGVENAFGEFTAALREMLVPAEPPVAPAEETVPPVEEAAEPLPAPAIAEEGIIAPTQEPAPEIAPMTEPVIEPTAEPDPPAVDYEAMIVELETVFADAMGEFVDSLNSVDPLGEISAPSGNGGAYAKFLAMYNEMRGITTTAPAAEESTEPVEPVDLTETPEPVDTVA